MTTEPDLSAIVRSWLRESDEALPASPGFLDPVITRLPATPQQRHWWPPLPVSASRRGARHGAPVSDRVSLEPGMTRLERGSRIRWGSLTMFSFVRVTVMVAAIALGTGLVLSTAQPGGHTGPGAAPAADVPLGAAQVVLGIYSGRPDPTWPLTAAESEDLDRIIAALPEVVGAPPTGGLGYHGFTVTGSEGAWTVCASRQPHSPVFCTGSEGAWTAYLGTVAPSTEGTLAYRSDPERLVEHFLLETGRPYLVEEEIAEVERSLADDS